MGRGMLQALTNADITVICQDRDLAVSWAHNVPAKWGREHIIGLKDEDFLPRADIERITELKRRVLRTGKPEKLEIRQAASAGGGWYDVWLDAARADGDICGVVMTLVEVTAHKHREQTLRTLLREVSHRSKNLLAIIQSIANQTGRHSDDIEQFLSRFRGRLQSLAQSQDLVTSSNWRGAQLSQLVRDQLDRYCIDPATSIRLEGPEPHLSPNAAIHIGLALHELAVNSVSYGALSRPGGKIEITTALDGQEGEPDLLLTWREEGAQGVANAQKRFGSIALERVVPASIDGEATLEIGDGKVEYRLRVPNGNFEL